MMPLKVVFKQTLSVAFQQIKSGKPWNIIRRYKASAASSEAIMKNPIADQGSQISCVENDEWNSAKPFEEIPGFRKLPILGTLWAYFPVVGKLLITLINSEHAERHWIYNFCKRRNGSSA